MATVTFENHRVELRDGESVLDGLLRSGIDAPHSCRAGTCQSCLMRVTEGAAPAKSQAGLKQALQMQGYFLPCVCHPDADLTIARPDAAALQVAAVVHAIERLSDSVLRLRLAPRGPFEHRAGQFVNLVRADGLTRSYSIASLPGRDEHLELHVRVIPGGRMTTWLCDEAKPGDELNVRGPAGECFYVPGTPDQPLLLIGTGTGLAPLWGILHDALANGHTGQIVLIHGGLNEGGLYLVDQLRALASQHDNFRYVRCLLNGDCPGADLEVGDVAEFVKRQFPKLSGWRVYLCGNPELVNKLKRQAFLAGAPMKQIHADPFVMSKA